MLVAYCRVSTTGQEAGYEAQLRDLKAAGCDETFSEQTSSIGQRPELERAMQFVRKGDTLVVTKLDRLARSMRDLISIVDRIEAKGAALCILDIKLDTSAPTGRLMLNLLGSVAQFEREMMLERQKEGIAKARAEGKFAGRKPTARAQAARVHELHKGGMGPNAIAREVGIGRSSVYRILESNGAARC